MSLYEELCNKLAVIVKGQLTFIGTPHELRTVFGRNYKLTIHAGDPAHGTLLDMVNLREFVETTFAGSVLNDSESHKRRLSYYIPHGDLTLATLYRRLEAAKALYNIDHFLVEATALEDVFLRLTAKKPPNGRVNGAGKQT